MGASGIVPERHQVPRHLHVFSLEGYKKRALATRAVVPHDQFSFAKVDKFL